MIVQREVDKEELQQAAAQMCRRICKYVELWDENEMGGELAESHICKSCPMAELISATVAMNDSDRTEVIYLDGQGFTIKG